MSEREQKRLEKRNQRGETQLHLAVMKGDERNIKKLIRLGANVNARDNAGNNFDYCFKCFQIAIVTL